MVFDRRLRAETNIFYVNTAKVQSHGRIIIIYRCVWVGAGGAKSEGAGFGAGKFLRYIFNRGGSPVQQPLLGTRLM